MTVMWRGFHRTLCLKKAGSACHGSALDLHVYSAEACSAGLEKIYLQIVGQRYARQDYFGLAYAQRNYSFEKRNIIL